MYERVCAQIDLDAIENNFNQIHKNINADTRVIAVIKTDGYGHGAIEIANLIEEKDYIWGFATATVEEALILRRHNVKKPILILGYTFEAQYEDMIKNDIRPAVFGYETALKLSETAVKLNKNINIHIKLDTGMGRIGFLINEQSADEILKISKLKNLVIEGIFTHFSKADEIQKDFTDEQIEQYKKMVRMLEDRNVDIAYKHCSNSAAIIDIPKVNMNLVRAGIIIYGLWPSDEVSKDRLKLKPALRLVSEIVHVKKLPEGKTISYGGTYKTTREQTIATIAVGYGDGYPRSLSNKGYVLINGKKAQICGRICMDQFMVDVTDIENVKVTDEVVLVGKSADKEITLEELGELSQRFNYEFACDLGKRIPRAYIKNGKVISTRDYFNE